MRSVRVVLVTVGLVLGVGLLPVRADAQPADPDEELLRRAGVGTDSGSLLAFLRQRSASDEDLDQVGAYVKQLGSTSFAQREKAAHKLITLELVALPLLRQNQANPDREIARRAGDCVAQIEKNTRLNLPLAAVRLLLRRTPHGVVAGLLRYLPFTTDADVQEAIYFGLDDFTVQTGRVDPVLMAALSDHLPARRALAGCIVGSRGSETQRAAVRKLLSDRDPLVRLRAAQGLLAARERAAVPVLIALLDESSVEVSWQAEELLHWLAEYEGPEEVVGAATAAQRHQCRAAWAAWWRDEGARLDLNKLDREDRRPLLLLVRLLGGQVKDGLGLCGSDGRVRWRIEGLDGVCYAQFLSGNRVLVGEVVQQRDSLFPRLVQRNLTGALVWQLPGAPVCPFQHLRDGTTFVAVEREVVGLVSEGKEAYRLTLPLTVQTLNGVRQMANGRFLFVSGGERKVVEVDPLEGPGKPRTQGLDRLPVWRRTIRLRSGRTFVQDLQGRDCTAVPVEHRHLLATVFEGQQVLELDAAGAVVWKCVLPGVSQPFGRLGNGNSLVFCEATPEGNVLQRVVEVDRAGKAVFQTITEGKPLSLCLPLVRVGFSNPPPGDVDQRALAAQLRGLRHKRVEVRQLAAWRLWMLGPRAKPPIGVLIEALRDSDSTVRHHLEGALLEFKPDLIRTLLQSAKYPNAQVRAEVASLIPQFQMGAQHILRRGHTTDQEWEAATAQVAQFQAEAKEAIPVLVSLLKDSDARVRERAAWALGYMPPWNWRTRRPRPPLSFESELKAAVPALIEALRDKDTAVRERAAESLGYLAPIAQEAVPFLLRAFEERTTSTQGRRSIARAFGYFGREARAAVPVLIEAMRDEDLGIAGFAADALGEIGPEHPAVIPALTRVLREKKYVKVRPWVAGALGTIGPKARAAVPELVRTLEVGTPPKSESEERARQIAAWALGAIGPGAESSVPALIQVVNDKRQGSKTRQAAARALGEIGVGTREVVNCLKAAEKEEDPGVRAEAEVVLEKLHKERAVERILLLGGKIEHPGQDRGESGLRVNLRGRDVRDADLALLRGLPHITILQLSGSGITDSGLASLKLLTGLEKLELAGTRITDAGLANLERLRRLRSLDLSGTKVTDAGMAHLSALTDLEQLSLGSTRLRGPGLSHLRKLRKLKYLNLFDTRVTDTGLAPLEELHRLRYLNLFHCRITDAGLAHIKGHKNLESLDLSGTKVSDEGLINLAGLKNLESLVLSKTRVTDKGIRHLQGLTNLRTLNLSGLEVDPGVAHLKGLRKLRRLYLAGTSVTDTNLVHLSGLSELEELSLRRTKITDVGLVHLAGLTHLKLLDLSGTRVSDQRTRQLRKLLPDVQIAR